MDTARMGSEFLACRWLTVLLLDSIGRAFKEASVPWLMESPGLHLVSLKRELRKIIYLGKTG